MDLQPEARIRTLPGMLVVSVRGTPAEAAQRETLATVEAALAAPDAPGLLYILDMDSDATGLETLLAVPARTADATRTVYAVSTAAQLEALRARVAGCENLAVFGEITAAYAFLSG